MLAAPVWATSFYSRPFSETVQEAPVIVRGRVDRSYSDWAKGADGARRIYTFYNVEVTETLKGPEQPATLVMRELGGEKDGVGMQVAGAAHFEPGEDVVTLLSARNSDGTFDVHGLMMAKLDVLKDDAGAEYLSGPALDTTRKWTLQDLRQLVASARAGTAANPGANPISAPKSSPSAALKPAPQLQSDHDHDEDVATPSDGRKTLFGVLLLGILLIAGAYVARRRR